MCGSSPLARGKPRRRRAGRPQRGLIPARAGKTCQCCSRCSQRPAHPRSRGENTITASGSGSKPGSSPLARGKHHPCGRWAGGSGLIPARAGKTIAIARCVRPCWAHPRSRGENPSAVCAFTVRVGSSPLARGKPRGLASTSAHYGLIPARAGKTTPCPHGPRRPAAHPRSRGENCSGHGSLCCRAHPRSRGENCKVQRVHLSSSGSSPLARENLTPAL